MGHQEEPAVLAAYLRTLGYTTEDVAGCVHVQVSRAYRVTIECEPDGVRFVSQADGSLGAFCWAFVVILVATCCVLLFVDTTGWMAAYVTASMAVAGLPSLVSHVVRYARTENAINTLRILVALKGVAEPASRVEAATAGRVVRAVGLR